MRLQDNNSKGRTQATTVSMAMFYREGDEYDFEVDCPICDGDGWVYGSTRNDNEARMTCPHCGGDCTITVNTWIDDIEEEEETEETITINPYEDESLSYSNGYASDKIGYTKDYERMIGLLERRFGGKAEEIKKARELEKKKIAILETYKAELTELSKQFYKALESNNSYDSASDVLNAQSDLMEQIKVVNEKIQALAD